jgi:hypothetical protein
MTPKPLLVIATFLLTWPCSSPSFAQKAPGLYDACDVDNPPAACSGMKVAIVAALAPPTGQPVDSSNPRCSSANSIDYTKYVLEAINKSQDPDALEEIAGDFFEVFQAQVGKEVLKHTSGELHNFILRNGPKASGAECVPVAAFLPSKATIHGIRLFVHDIDAAPPQHWGGCGLAGEECSIGFSRFIVPPVELSEAGGQAVATTFANWSHDRRRVGHLYVFFSMPQGMKVAKPI